MAIAFDAASKSSAGTGNTLTWSHTVTGSQPILFVLTSYEGLNVPTGVTYNGVAMTRIFGINTSDSNDLWYLINPATGANNVVATWNSSGPNRIASAASYTGVKQTGQPEAQTTPTRNSSTSSLSQNLDTIADNSWVIMAGFSSASNLAAGTATTQRGTTANTGGGFWYSGLFDNNAAKTPAGTVTLQITCSSSSVAAMGMVSIAPHTAVAFAPKSSLLGVGR